MFKILSSPMTDEALALSHGEEDYEEIHYQFDENNSVQADEDAYDQHEMRMADSFFEEAHDKDDQVYQN